MKQIILFAFLSIFWSCSTTNHLTIDSNNVKIVTGKCERKMFLSDPAFKEWYDSHYSEYHPDEMIISQIDSLSKNISFLVFLGTWCGDSKREIPHFFKILDETNISDSIVALYGLDRSKKSDDGLTEKYGIVNVPTIIVLNEGHELGRIVEQPQETLEKDLERILHQH